MEKFKLIVLDSFKSLFSFMRETKVKNHTFNQEMGICNITLRNVPLNEKTLKLTDDYYTP